MQTKSASTLQQVTTLVGALFEDDDLVEVRAIHPGGKPTLQEWVRACEVGDLYATCVDWNRQDYGVYYGVNPRFREGGKAADVQYVRSLCVDFDEPDTPAEALLQRIDDANLPAPTVVVFTGGGHHVYWRLDEPLADRGEYTGRQKGLIDALGSDKAIHDLPRVMRMPGFKNTKPGRHNALCRLVEVHPERARPACEFPEPVAPAPTPSTPAVGNGERRELSKSTLESIAIGDDFTQEQRNDRLYKAAADMAGSGYSREDIEARLRPPFEASGLSPGEIGKTIASACNSPRGASIPPTSFMRAGETGRDGNEEEYKPHIVNVRLSEVECEFVRWLWEPRVPLGKLSVIAGNPGLGKTFLGLDLVGRVTHGRPWPDRQQERNEPGDAIILSAEDGVADTIKPRLENAAADCSRVHVIEGVQRSPEPGDITMFSLDRDVRQLDAMLTDIPETRLVLIDPLSAYCDGVDTHRDSDTRAVLAPLAALAEKHCIAVVGIMHLNKGGASKSLYRLMGSLAFVAASRVAWLIHEDPNDKRRRLMLQVKNNLAPNPGTLAFQIVTPGCVHWHDGVLDTSADEVLLAQQGRPTSTRDEAVEWLRTRLSNGPVLASVVLAEGAKLFATRTLHRAKRSLGVVSRMLLAGNVGNLESGQEKKYHWVIPGGTPNNIYGNAGNVGNVGNVPAEHCQDCHNAKSPSGGVP